MSLFIKKLICKLLGHNYETSSFTANTLYFCSRCGKEMFNRGWDDLEPMTEQERSDFFNEYEGWR